ncbi:hypothetical protein GUJ93_ZPchr0458g22427 [Zizania palustris]|uniref:Uncharacterized protein n=1 Tax=Zizania palustris TaxID=103762 RepID=A0A8J5R7L9_ZIZPA|nr:hypothetical protein GUJ93_ZPchr0458g22427 [Zizania palustris]
MSSSAASCLAVSALLMLAVSASAAAAPTLEEPQHKRVLFADTHPQEEAMMAITMSGVKVASSSAPGTEKNDGGDAAVREGQGAWPSGRWTTQGNDQSSSSPSGGSGSGSGSGSNEHGKDEGSSSGKEGEKSKTKSCVSKEECHKKRLICGKGCTLSAHTKCAAKCSKCCIPTCT